MRTLAISLGISLAATIIISLYINQSDDMDTAVLDAKTQAYNQAKAENDSIQKKYDKLIINLMDSISMLRNEIQQSDLMLNQIKTKRNEKINSVNRLTTDELSRAITDNYKERIVD